MKRIVLSFLTAALLCALLLSALPMGVAADEPLTVEQLTATDINTPVNPNASQEAKNLLAYLQTLSSTNRFVTGTFDYGNNSFVYDSIKDQFDTEVGLYSCRYYVSGADGTYSNGQIYNFLDFYNVDTANRELKKHYDNGNILLVHTDGVLLQSVMQQYALSNGLADSTADLIVHLDETNPERDLWMYQCLQTFRERTVEALRQLEDMGVKAYLYREWVEYNYGPQYGQTEEGKAAMRRVWQQTSQYMCQSGLKGFLLTYAPGGDVSETMEARYPGNAYVDVLSVTYYSYFNDSTPGQGGTLNSKSFKDYSWYIRTGKPIGFTETSCRTGDWTIAYSIGRQSWYNTLTSMITYWPQVCFVNCWADGHYSLLNETNGDRLEGNDDGYLYLNSPYSINLDELPDYRTGVIKAPGVAQVYTEKNYGGNQGTSLRYDNYTGLEEGTYSLSDLKALGLNPASIASVHLNDGYCLLGYDNDEATGTPVISSGYSLPTVDASKVRTLKVTRQYNVAFEVTVTASSNDEDSWKVNDGQLSRWTGETDANGIGWLMYEMEQPMTVTRWLVRHAGAAGDPAVYNTADFCLQYSTDGQNWKTVDTVTGNNEGLTDRTLSKEIVAQYFRLYITKANSTTSATEKNRMNIVEWELYGLPAAVKTAADTENNSGSGDGDIDNTVIDDTDNTETDNNVTEEPDGKDEDDTPTPSKKRVVRKVINEVIPWWVYVIGGVVVAAGVTVLVILLLRRKKKNPQPTNQN